MEIVHYKSWGKCKICISSRWSHLKIPPALDELVVRLMSKRPEDRPASAQEVKSTLDGLVSLKGEAPAGKIPLLEWIVRGRLVGREDELNALREHWGRVQQGQAHLLLISGEPGIGKTRLANELVAFARLQGAAVLQGGCYEYEATVPYLPLAEALRDWVDAQPSEVLREHLGVTATELSRLAPEIEQRLGALPPNPPLTPEEERLRLFDHLSRFLQGLATQRGLLLFVDDLHWADRGTLLLLHYLLRRLRSERLMVLGAYREVELDRKHPLAEALVEWNRERIVTRLPLNRLTQEACGALLAGMFGKEAISDEFTQAVYGETEGNPFFVEEVIKALVESGQIYRLGETWEQEEIADLAIPQSIKEAIGRRLNRLSAQGAELLHAAAVLGKTFSFTELRAALTPNSSSPPGQDQLLDALDEALSAQLICVDDGELFSFTHDKIRETLYEELNPVRRRRLHLRLAQGLEHLYAGHISLLPVQDLAHHFLQGGDLQQGLHYSMLAAQQASQLYAYDQAEHYYLMAADCCETLQLPVKAAEIFESIGDMQFIQGICYPAVESFQVALNMVSLTTKKAELKTKIGSAYAQIGDQRGLQFLQEAQRELDPALQADELAYNLATVGRYQHYHAQHRQAIASFERALSLAEPLDNALTLTHIYGYLAGAYQHLLEFEQSMAWARECISLGERKDFPLAAAVGYEFLSEDYTVLGQWREAIRDARRNREIGEQIGSLERVAWSGLALSYGLYGRGDLEAARQEAQNSLELAEKIDEHRLQILLHGLLGRLEMDLGLLDDARATAEIAMNLADKLGQILMQSQATYTSGYLLIKQGECEQALNLYQDGKRRVAETDNRWASLLIDMLGLQANLCAGRYMEAERIAADLLDLTRQRQLRHFEGITLCIQAQIYTAQDRWQEAGRACDQAIAVLEETGTLVELGRVYYQRALLRQAERQSDLAEDDLSHARELFEKCGARLDLE